MKLASKGVIDEIVLMSPCHGRAKTFPDMSLAFIKDGFVVTMERQSVHFYCNLEQDMFS